MKQLVGEVFRSFSRHGGRLLGGAVAFYALLSTAPFLFVVVDVAAHLTSREAARAEMLRGLQSWLGVDGARTIGMLLDSVPPRHDGVLFRIVGALVLVYGSGRLFAALQRALNHMWDVSSRSGSGLRGKTWKQIRKRVVAFVMVLICGAFLIVSVALRTALEAAEHAIHADAASSWRMFDHVLSFGVCVVLFALVFRILPDVRIAWRDAFAGSLVTSVLFSVGKFLIAAYLAHRAGAAAFGVAGSLVVTLLWVHYSAQIFFLGAAYTAVRAARAGRPLEPTELAVRIHVEAD